MKSKKTKKTKKLKVEGTYEDIDMYDHPHASMKYMVKKISKYCNWPKWTLASTGGPLSNTPHTDTKWTAIIDLGMAGKKTFEFDHVGRLLRIN